MQRLDVKHSISRVFPPKESDGQSLKNAFAELKIPNEQFVRLSLVLERVEKFIPKELFRNPNLTPEQKELKEKYTALLRTIEKIKQAAKDHRPHRIKLTSLKQSLINILYRTAHTYYTQLVKYYSPSHFQKRNAETQPAAWMSPRKIFSWIGALTPTQNFLWGSSLAEKHENIPIPQNYRDYFNQLFFNLNIQINQRSHALGLLKIKDNGHLVVNDFNNEQRNISDLSVDDIVAMINKVLQETHTFFSTYLTSPDFSPHEILTYQINEFSQAFKNFNLFLENGKFFDEIEKIHLEINEQIAALKKMDANSSLTELQERRNGIFSRNAALKEYVEKQMDLEQDATRIFSVLKILLQNERQLTLEQVIYLHKIELLNTKLIATMKASYEDKPSVSFEEYKKTMHQLYELRSHKHDLNQLLNVEIKMAANKMTVSDIDYQVNNREVAEELSRDLEKKSQEDISGILESIEPYLKDITEAQIKLNLIRSALICEQYNWDNDLPKGDKEKLLKCIDEGCKNAPIQALTQMREIARVATEQAKKNASPPSKLYEAFHKTRLEDVDTLSQKGYFNLQKALFQIHPALQGRNHPAEAKQCVDALITHMIDSAVLSRQAKQQPAPAPQKTSALSSVVGWVSPMMGWAKAKR